MLFVMTGDRHFAHSRPECFRDSEAISRPAAGGSIREIEAAQWQSPAINLCVNSVCEVRRNGR
jgi:hypothetical protein